MKMGKKVQCPGAPPTTEPNKGDTRLREAGAEAVYCLARGAPKGPNKPRAQLNHQGPLFPGHGYATHSQTWGRAPSASTFVAFFYGLMYIAQHDLSVVPGAVAYTKTERQWYKPRDLSKVSEQFGSVVFCKHTCQKMSSAPKHHEKEVTYWSLRGDRLSLQPLNLFPLQSKLNKSGFHCFADALEPNDFLPIKLNESDRETTQKLPPQWLNHVEKKPGLTAYTLEKVVAVEEDTRL
ncbi:hypothetical protein HPB47_015989 [Ixodes persulcatus]|uniref:Uncharacterized protein n=1 Tax=Ixodes persulcatus TaxID=34615 RepID=A0AC60QS63_IXOPE|nr:hypothetical protein HPB47_015989 [Ixodes persulcatus]